MITLLGFNETPNMVVTTLEPDLGINLCFARLALRIGAICHIPLDQLTCKGPAQAAGCR